MKATLEFTLPDDRYAHLRAVHSAAAFSTLYDIDEYLRSAIKHGTDHKTPEDLAQHLRHEIAPVLALLDE